METAELKTTLETLLFITDRPLPLAQLAKICGEKDQAKVNAAIQEIRQDYEARASGIQVLEIAEGFQMSTKPAQAPFVRKLYADKMTMRLSSAALETLSIVAYKQPITRAEIEQIRGVEVIAALETLLERRLLKVVGRKETVGRPLLYGTTPDFLRHFGLKNLSELPPVDSFTPAQEPHPDLSEAAWEEAAPAATQATPDAQPQGPEGETPGQAEGTGGASVASAVEQVNEAPAAEEAAVAVADPPAAPAEPGAEDSRQP